jgi:DNA repair protein RecO (recombination protein O)
MFINYRTEGLILKKENRGEADRTFSLYTKDFGIIKVLGKGIRKISSKLRAGVEVFYFSEIEFIQAKRHKTLIDAVLIDDFGKIRKDLSRFKTACQISDIAIDFLKGQEGDKKIWPLLLEIFRKLNNIPEGKSQLLYYYFLFNFFSVLGYKIQLDDCSVCGGKVFPEEIFFKASRGGIICKKCSGLASGAKPVGSQAIKIMRLVLKGNWGILSKISIGSDYLKSLDAISKSYISYISGITK